jgi:hypothetical protein
MRASIVLGVSGGFRQDLLAFLFVPWLLAIWLSATSKYEKLINIAVLLVAVSAWLIPTVYVAGGLQEYARACGFVTSFAARESITLEGSVQGFLRNMVRFSAALATGGGVLALCAAALHDGQSRLALRRLPAAVKWVLISWIAIPLLFFAVVFIHKPGYILPILPGIVIAAFAGLKECKAHRLSRRIAVVSMTIGLVFFLAVPSFQRFAGKSTGYMDANDRLSPAMRVFRQFSRVTRDEIAVQDEEISDMNGLLRKLSHRYGEVAIVTLPNSRYNFRVAMYEWPAVVVYHVDCAETGVKSVLRGVASSFQRIDPLPGQSVVLGARGRLVWLSAYNAAVALELERNGGVKIDGPHGTRVWVTEAGKQALVWCQ